MDCARAHAARHRERGSRTSWLGQVARRHAHLQPHSIMPSFVRSLVTAGAVLSTLLACDQPDAATAPALRLADQSLLAVVPIHPYGIGADRSPGQGCVAAEYRQFDFWLGNWHVFVPGTTAPVFAGTNVIERELDGCVVEENWTDIARGRSINAYDASDGKWHQHWVYAGGGPSSVLILEGGSPGSGRLAMAATRIGLNNNVVRDSIAWTAITPDSVRQHWVVSLNGGAFFTSFDGRYRRVAQVTPLPVTFIPTCTNRPANHQFDFLLGEWQVSRAHAPQGAESGPVTASVTSDLDHCLIEERVEGPDGYRGMSFSGFYPVTQTWYRTYLDNRGQRILLSGGQSSNGRMVLTGSKRAPDGGTVLVRVTYEPVSNDQVVQRWEFSRDGGTTWPVEQEVRIARSQ